MQDTQVRAAGTSTRSGDVALYIDSDKKQVSLVLVQHHDTTAILLLLV